MRRLDKIKNIRNLVDYNHKPWPTLKSESIFKVQASCGIVQSNNSSISQSDIDKIAEAMHEQ